MPQCCRCNGNGRCRSCFCVRSGLKCINCLPLRRGRCENFEDSSPQPAVSSLIQSDLSTSSFSEDESELSLPIESEADATSTRSDLVEPVDLTFPSFVKIPENPQFVWGDVDGNSFVSLLDQVYDEIVHWRRNIFSLPTGRSGKMFVMELSRLFNAYYPGSSLEGVALKAAMTLPILILQKPFAKSKSSDHVHCIERRMKLWLCGDLSALLVEGRSIQRGLTSPRASSDPNNVSFTFSKLMLQGKVRAALRLLSDHENGHPLQLDQMVGSKSVRDTLLDKHPPGCPLDPRGVVPPVSGAFDPHPVYFDRITGLLIRSIALHVDGAAGPSNLDAHGWRRICTSFHGASADICNALAGLARRLCTEYVDPAGLTAFTACRLIALDKHPGVRPIGVGEVIRRIVGKAILSIVGVEIQQSAGSLQLCAGQPSGCEAAVHALRQIFDDANTQAALLVDASNAFNNLNRQLALTNISSLCPAFSRILVNTYRCHAKLFVGGETILSQEGTTQGDPLAMPMYALALVPMIARLRNVTKQVWYADDAAAAGRLTDLRTWWDMLCAIGPQFGYFVNSSKTFLIVKETHLPLARSIFGDTGIQLTTEGRRYLGAALGSSDFVRSYVNDKVKEWSDELLKLSEIGLTQPHAAFSALTHGLLGRWTFLSRTMPDIDELLSPLEQAIRLHLLPALTGKCAFSDVERQLISLPSRLGGLGIIDPCVSSAFQFSASQRVTGPLVSHLVRQDPQFTVDLLNEQLSLKRALHFENHHRVEELAASLHPLLPSELQCAREFACLKGASSWLSVLPLDEHGFSLHKGDFRDAVCLRYGWSLSYLPTECVCGVSFSVEHAFTCPHGGYPTLRHNEIRDITAQMMSEVCPNVATEPTLQPVTNERFFHRSANTEDGARLDVRAQGFWGIHHQQAYFDIRVFNPLAKTNRQTSLPACFRSHDREKRRIYEQRVLEVERGSFTPLVFSALGGVSRSTEITYKRLASLIAHKKDHHYNLVISLIRCRLSFSLLRSAIMCLRGSRSTAGHPQRGMDFVLAPSEGRLPLTE